VQCFAYEPEPTNLSHLSDNIQRNVKHANFELLQVAIVDSIRTVMLGIAKGNISDHRIGFNDARQTVQVRGIPLDEFSNRVVEPLAVKMDIQGAEPLAIIGGDKTLSKAELVIMEFWPNGIGEHGVDAETIIESIGGFSQVTQKPLLTET
jgi:FkbM family methyltransferase